MALKIEHKCTRCSKTVAQEVQDVRAATEAEDRVAARARVLSEIQEFLGTFDPDMLPDLLVVRRGQDTITQSFLCDEEDAKRSCAARVDTLIDECKTFDPRKPKTKKAAAAT